MKHRLLYTLGLIVLSMVAFGTSPGMAQTTAPGPYYATPSWDQKLPASSRFIVLSNWDNAAVLDRETGLVWQKSPSIVGTPGNSVNWEQALFHCIGREQGNRMGWRLPTIQDLASLVDLSVPPPGPTLPAGHPFSNVQSDDYWSASTDYYGNAFVLRFSNGGPYVSSKHESVTHFVWCVRGGLAWEPQRAPRCAPLSQCQILCID